MPYAIANFYRPASLVVEFVEAGQPIQWWGDRTHLWLEPSLEDWQGVVTLINAVVQLTLKDASKALDDPKVILCDTGKVETILQQLMVAPASIESACLTSVTVSPRDRQRWVERLEWNEEPQADGPLHFYHCQRSPTHPGVVLPLEALDVWLSKWDWAFFYWQDDQRKAAPWIAHAQAALLQIRRERSGNSLSALEAWARHLDQLEPTQANTHAEWNRLHLALVPTGIFAPEDDGDLVQSLIEAGHPAIARYREAALALRAHAEILPGIFLPDCHHPLAATVSLHWFRLGPFHSDRWHMIEYLKYGLNGLLDNAPQSQSGGFISGMGGFIGGSFKYAHGIAGTSQLYRGSQAIDPQSFDGYRLCTCSGRLSRAGHTTLARIISAIGVLREPEQFQHWVELGMTLWYDARQAEGMACLEYAATLDQGFAVSPFIQDRRAECSTVAALPDNPGDTYLHEALPDFWASWLALSPFWQFSLVWLRSLLREPFLTQSWLALLGRMEDGYLSREIVRGLTAESREMHLARLPSTRRLKLKAHLF